MNTILSVGAVIGLVTGLALGAAGMQTWTLMHAPSPVVATVAVPQDCDQRTAFFAGDGDVAVGCALAGKLR